MINTIDRYVFREILRIFLLVLVCFFALFVLIDYTSRSSGLHLKGMELAFYYFHLFVRRIEILAPFALLISVVRLLCQANMRYELVSIMACGIPLRRALRSIVVIGFCCTALLYLNYQFLFPDSLKAFRRIEDLYASKMDRRQHLPSIESIVLGDGSRLLYRRYDSAQGKFLDAFWIRSLDDIYRIQALSPLTVPPMGHFVEHFERNLEGKLLLVKSDQLTPLDGITFDETVLNDAVTPPSDRSLVSLWTKLPHQTRALLSPEQAQVEAAFYRKLVMPLLALLVCLGPAALCVRFRRPVPVFAIYACGLSAIILTYLWLSAASVLAQSQVLSPWLGMVLPVSLLLVWTSWRWVRLRG